ncbi:related to purine utilization positive regulator [Fusarium fujikuroi IMI 58289]|uniref:Related to purine utilization positive regulator n=1 Tax=Gibberella fujikuroi (strain CBS 195.34 / IMI 58289 / NRRL A-6831) TaxID=1279085 RepID=S0EJM6_GIBF5|nr:related to purine utilization positive regulator [Fusarium fujikuroi IMI 58289]KLO95102.1 purine utilization positive regulator [Fusarium fujikuroi]CCT72573.1 related to purine utilization positive regulator [Fusarium fujikuroi IMI 58289]SCO12853.1 related to purine utilization positive regulator [Fusarium fujikuroi]SCO22986.1 related to purine utilization positive regulator [Fusarium fujikuroi]SCO39931.1 related to purine utilization positive regulator [Fusarium fujikuroi]
MASSSAYVCETYNDIDNKRVCSAIRLPSIPFTDIKTEIPACQPCQNSGSICDYTDGRSGDVHPRSYIHDLEAQLMQLESQLREVDEAATTEVSPPTSTLRSDDEPAQDLIRVGDEGHAHFIGASSGMYLVRSVLESAQQNYPNFESPSETTEARTGPKEPASSSTRIALPSRETANSLIDTFFSQYQVQYPILDQQEFNKAVTEFYSRQNDRDGQNRPASGEVWTQFMLNMVLAISLMFMSNDHNETTTLSKSFTANAMEDISLIMQTKNVKSVQCLLLLLLLSILDSSSAPVWYISGLCMRMCIDLGYHSEATIAISSTGHNTEVERVSEADTKRRLFWVTYSFDRTLNILLGRPFTFDDFTVDIHLPRHSLVPNKRPQILHWLELQQLESEIVHKLHAVRRDDTAHVGEDTDLTEWTKEMAQRLKGWNSVALTLTDSDGHNVNWWGYWYRTALLILYRPSPLRPNLSTSDTLSCYEAAKDLIQLSYLRISEGLMEFTWIDLHFQFMSGVTLVFIVWKNTQARIKAKDDWVSFKSCLFQWKSILERLGMRWERIARAREALSKLADATIDLVEKDMMRSAGGGQRLPIHHNSEESRRDRRRSIIQQLRRQDSDGVSQRNLVVGSDANMQDSSPREVNLERGNRGMDQIYGPPVDAGTQHRSAAHTAEYRAQATGENWTTLDTSTNTQRGLFGDTQSHNTISSMIPEDTWPLFDLSDVAVAPDELNFWTYLSAPMLGVEDIQTSQFNATGRPDDAFTNSILNFHGDFSNITPEMPVEYPEDADYGYNAGQ